jgi:AcrR family transcriptional regulator
MSTSIRVPTKRKNEKPAKPVPPYHHGDLRDALLRSAETILRRDGFPALTLRACAREAGVSHAAPAHHFPNLSSLLSELAAEGFSRLTDAVQKALDQPKATPVAAGIAYVKFAKENPDLFYLMSDPSRLDSANPLLQAARRKAILALAGTRAVAMDHPTLKQLGEIAGNWALVHGFAMLMLTGRLNLLLRLAPDGATDMDLLESTLISMKRD